MVDEVALADARALVDAAGGVDVYLPLHDRGYDNGAHDDTDDGNDDDSDAGGHLLLSAPVRPPEQDAMQPS